MRQIVAATVASASRFGLREIFFKFTNIPVVHTLERYTADDPAYPHDWTAVESKAASSRTYIIPFLMIADQFRDQRSFDVYRIETLQRVDDQVDVSYDVYYSSF